MGFNRDTLLGISCPEWNTPPHGLRLEPTEVHVWCATLNPPSDRIEELFHILSPDERLRAKRFYFERDRWRFIVARGILRMILSLYLKVEPGRVMFRYGPHGKPFLSIESDQDVLQFNLSHSQGLALYAFTYSRAIGIDVEYIKPQLDVEGIAARFFSPSESAMLLGLPETQKLDAFFNCWTRKEAYLKAKGIGLSLPLDQFDVSFVRGKPACILKTRGDPQEADRWSLQELTPATCYTGAVAVEGYSWALKCWRWVEPYSL